jgi:hypothetical protein
MITKFFILTWLVVRVKSLAPKSVKFKALTPLQEKAVDKINGFFVSNTNLE